ncbi:MAG: acetate--CoA ligase [Methanomassiliicoccales archaeon]
MSEKTIESVMAEERRFEPSPEFRAKARVKSMEEYERMYRESISDPAGFWAKMAKQEIEWFSPWTNTFSWDEENVIIKWFEGGKLNASYNCLDRHVKSERKNKAAIIWQGEPEEDVRTLTYQQLHREVCRCANLLKELGVSKGDRVSIYLPMIPELAISMLACARIGAIHSVVFGGFSSESLRDRINDSNCKVLITADGAYRSGKHVQLKQNADVAMEKGTSIEKVVVVKRAGFNIEMKEGRDIWYHEAIARQSDKCEPEWMDAEDPLFILYTSGSTGKPKGVLHTTGGYMVYATTTFKYIFDYRDEDTYWCTADIGWITGHSYILYGPLSAGATSLMFEGVPTYPQVDRFWHIVEKFKVNIFYTAPTAIRSLMREGEKWPAAHDLSSLRLLGTVGEPINPEAWIWYHTHIGRERCPIVDTWWQTETGGILITPLPGATTTKPGSATKPFFGVEPAIYKDDGSEAAVNEGGYLVIKRPWPGIMRTVFGQHERFKEIYWSRWPGVYFTGDGARKDEDGYFWIMGRVDDVIKVSGHRIGAAEVESALVSHPKVAEAAVVPIPHDIKGEAIYAYVTLKAGVHGTEDLKKELVQHVRKMVGPIATPEVIQFADGMPKTRSGKIMRRILRKVATGETESIGDTSTLADPSVVDRLIEGRIELRKG